ncbi:MAG: hypothetical protein JXQ73_24055 [Phycisphaerae bacterium]|nr:hypothetical protein [Phycisphaerae bacterium]
MAPTSRVLGWVTKGSLAWVMMQTASCDLSDPATRDFILDRFVVPQAIRFFSDNVFFFLDKALILLTT